METTHPLVSVIIPVYNVEKYLNKCIQSVLNQTYKNLEIILVDDGSTDKSPLICEEFGKKDSRIKIIHKKNGGLSSARNIGIKKCHGEYVTFIDSDDYVDFKHIEILANAAIKFNVDIAISNIQVTTKKSAPQLNNQNYKVNLISSKEVLRNILLEKDTSISANSKLYRKELFSNTHFPEGRLYEDNGCIHRIIMQCNKIAHCIVKSYYYYIHSNSITHSKFNIKKIDYITLVDQSCKDILSLYPDLLYPCMNRQATARISILNQILNNGQQSSKEQNIANHIVNDLKTHFKSLVVKKGISTKVRISIILLMINRKLLQWSGRAYERIK